MVHQIAISNHPYTKPFIRDGNDTLQYLNDCNDFIEGFDVEIPEVEIKY